VPAAICWEHQHLHITAFLEFILKPISAEFCKNCPNECCQDSCQYIGDLLMWKERFTKKLESTKQKPVFYIVAADVKALYPSLYRDTVTKVLECALEKHSNYSAEARKIIVELNKICLNNVATQYGDQLYIQKNGIITGDNHSVSLANIAVHYILQPIADVLNEAELFRRFIDDIIWISANIKWMHSTSTNFSFWEQWLGTNVPTSMHCRENRRSWISRRQSLRSHWRWFWFCH